MTNEYGEYLNHKIKHSKTQQERQYYEELAELSESNPNYEYNYTNPSTNQAYVPQPSRKQHSYLSIEPTTVKNDIGLQDALAGIDREEEEGDRDLNFGKTWGGMESGAIT